MTSPSYAEVFCPRCGFSFKAEVSNAGKTIGGGGGALAGAALGAKIGIVAGPLGAMAGTIPGAILGAIFGTKGGNLLDKPRCPKCGQAFDMVQPRSPQMRQTTIPSLFEELGSASDAVIELAKYKDEKLALSMHGSIALAGIVRGANDTFGLAVKDGSPISEFMDALEIQDIDEMCSILLSMIVALQQIDTRFDRGVLMCFFITGEEAE